MEPVKKMKTFRTVFKRLHFEKVLIAFAVCFIAASCVILAAEPGITSLGDALWYTFVACTSIGFGDLVAMTVAGRIITVIMTVFEILLVAVFSGVVVSYYLEVIHRRENQVFTLFLNKMEHLTELSPEELAELQEKVRQYRM